MSAGVDSLEWTPTVDSEGATLTISDPQGHVRARRFASGHAILLPLFGAGGLPLADGTYTWELRFTTVHGGSAATPFVESGYFTIAGGAVVPFDLAEAAAGGAGSGKKAAVAADQIVPDDFVVDGKGCIGLGCVNNEPFGAEALRLKQSVVRLRLEDTSTTGGFPARDWQLTANDSASGGADRFSLDDLTAGTTPLTIRGGAPSNSLYLNNLGNVGLGTATPGASLHVSRVNGTAQVKVTETSPTDTPRVLVNLENTGQVQFRLKNTNVLNDWLFTGSNAFQIDNLFHAGVEFQVNPEGMVLVQGDLFVHGTQMNVPDYVFEPGYPLMPLDELAAFVARERHLPNMPSAHEIESSGLKVGESQMRVLEKVEELTLYALAQQEEITALREENTKLEARLAALERSASAAVDPALQRANERLAAERR